MTHRKKLKRIVTCQGGIQLVAALAALRSHESEQKRSGADHEYEDFLVVYDLSAPPDQIEKFASVVRQMAMTAANWEAATHITHEQMSDFANVDISRAANVFAKLYELVGTSKADEIYLCRNFVFSNSLMMNAYSEAEKICYGDGIGIYFSKAYFLPTVVPRNGLALIREKLAKLKCSLGNRITAFTLPDTNNNARISTVLREKDFDIGYFLLPDILGEHPPMKTRVVRKELTTGIFRKLAGALDGDHIADRLRKISRVSTVVLLTSNFTESGRMSGENEILAYTEFLERQNLPRESTLIIKPHPRDRAEKIQLIGWKLRDLFSEVILLTDPNLFFVPFEIFLMRTVQGENEKTLRNLNIVTFSTACLSLEFFFNLGPIIGFGSELVSKYFNEAYVSGRIKHEHDLQLALQRLAQTT